MQQRAIAGLVFGLLALLGLFGVGGNLHRGIYLVIFSVVIGPAACWLCIGAMRKARKSATMRPRGAIAGTIFGSLASMLALFFLLTFALFASQLTQYSRCLATAQTLSAQQSCSSQFYKAVDGKIGSGTG